MFTGLIEAIGTVRDFRKTGSVFRLSVEWPKTASELTLGQSVSVGGVCLTVVGVGNGVFEVDMIPETCATTRFSSLSRGDRLNLERAMRLNGRLEGHLVLGHVDGTATLEKLTGFSSAKTALFRASENVTRYIVSKGSIAVDGVSLTVIDAEEHAFSVGLIPATLENSTLSLLRPGDTVNIETDIVGKYVERLLKGRTPKGHTGAITLKELYELGY